MWFEMKEAAYARGALSMSWHLRHSNVRRSGMMFARLLLASNICVPQFGQNGLFNISRGALATKSGMDTPVVRRTTSDTLLSSIREQERGNFVTLLRARSRLRGKRLRLL